MVFPPSSLQAKGGTTTFPGPMRISEVRLRDLEAGGIFRCGRDSENSGFDRSSIAKGWLLIWFSTSRAKSSPGVYIRSVSSSDGGFKAPLRASIAGTLLITKPALVKKIAIAVNPSARLRKEGFGMPDGGGAEATSNGQPLQCGAAIKMACHTNLGQYSDADLC